MAAPYPPVRVWFNKSFSSIHGVLRQLREDWGPALFLIGSHTARDFGPLASCDFASVEPSGLKPAEYVDWCLAFCAEHQVGVFIPGRLRDIIADRRGEFETAGVRLILAGDGDTLRLLEDKGRFLAMVPGDVATHRFERVRTWEEFETACGGLETAGLPACFKPATGTFGLGFYVLDEAMTPLKRLLRSEAHRISKTELRPILTSADSFPELLVMEYLDGSEFSVDVLARAGAVLAMVCRRKPMHGRVRLSGTSRTLLVDEGQSQLLAPEPEIERMVRRLTEHFHLGGLFNVQFRTRAELPERPCLLEINGRMSGGLPYIRLSGLNLALHAIRDALRNPDDPPLEIPEPQLPIRVQERTDVFIMPRTPASSQDSSPAAPSTEPQPSPTR